MGTTRLTTAQALVRFLIQQHVERDGSQNRFFAGCFGIFGHGNLAGIGQALQQYPQLRYHQARNEQAMVHTAIAYARHKNRLQAFACTASVGPGSTNMVTGAATATINRIPVLLLPGDVFATRRVNPALQQLEHPHSGDTSVNDCFRPVSRYWDRINRPEQLIPAALEALRVLTDPAETGAVTLALPQDVQAEAFDWPDEFFDKRVWKVRVPAEISVEIEHYVRGVRRPVFVVGGGTIYSGSAFSNHLAWACDELGIPVVETQAGKGALPYDHPSNMGAAGATGTSAANAILRTADLVIGLGTRYDDFTTASRTAFGDARFLNVNLNATDAAKLGGLPVIDDVSSFLQLIREFVGGTFPEGSPRPDLRASDEYRAEMARLKAEWEVEVDQLTSPDPSREHPSQAEVIGVVNAAALADEDAGRGATVVCAAGSLPGDLHKLWRTRDPKGYHVEYGYSCMGYEVAGGIGVKMADPGREVYVMVGDGSWLMMSSEIVTAVQERIRITVVLVDNHGFGSIGALSESLGSEGFGTRYRFRNRSGQLEGDVLPLDFVKQAEGMGAVALRCRSLADIERGLDRARDIDDRPVVLVIETDPEIRVPGYDSWWDVPVAEVSTMDAVRAAREQYEQMLPRERWFV